MPKRVLCLLTDGFEEIETVTPVDLLRRAGVEVVLASLNGGLSVTGRSGLTFQAEVRLEEVAKDDAFDLLFLPGGPAVGALREDGRAAQLARAFVNQGKTVAAICAAPLILRDAGLLEGRRHTAHDSAYGELLSALPEEAVVTDGPVITSRGAGTALPFGLKLVEFLEGQATAAKVAKAIMA